VKEKEEEEAMKGGMEDGGWVERTKGWDGSPHDWQGGKEEKGRGIHPSLVNKVQLRIPHVLLWALLPVNAVV
jgi:hypothetical protein